VTDSDGKFKVTGLPQRKYRAAVLLNDDQSKDWTGDGIKDVASTSRESGSADFQLVAGGVITGALTTNDGKPLGNSDFVVNPAGQNDFWQRLHFAHSKTDASGTYKVRVPAGEAEVIFATRQIPYKVKVVEDATVTQDCKGDVGPDALGIVGVVLDDNNKPVAGAVVRNIGPERYRFGPMDNPTDEKGRFWLMAESDAILSARKDEDISLTGVPVDSAHPDALIIHIKKGILIASITGRVLDADRKPISGARIWVMEVGRGSDHAIFTSKDGKYSAPYLDPRKRYAISANAKGYGSADSPYEAPYTFTSTKKHIKVDDLILQKADSFVAGKIIGGSGQPLSGAGIMADGYD
jgi:protocatechuate 3,4-dioxygenase beta subunit